MTRTILASEMRDRLLARLQTPRKSDDWVKVLATPGHRDLLALIAQGRPTSIGALAELAGRAQPNVSRALNALLSAGLVEVVSEGRRSVPRMTDLGAEKARELGLAGGNERRDVGPEQTAVLFSIDVPGDAAEEAPSAGEPASDALDGSLTCRLSLVSPQEQVAARTKADLDALGRRVLESWWRILYRRDAPFFLWKFTIESHPETEYALLATATGSRLNFSTRGSSRPPLHLASSSQSFAIEDFEEHLLAEVLRPLAACHRWRGRSARPLHALLARVEDSRGQPAERAFCRTAGALGLTAYDLADAQAAQIRDLLKLVPDEDARLDFGSAVLADSLAEGELWTREQLEKFRDRNAMSALASLRALCGGQAHVETRPYRKGYELARGARKALNLAEDCPVGGLEGLSRLSGASGDIGLSPKAPGALRAFQDFHDECPTIVLEDEGPQSSAFVLARGIGDFLAFGSRTACVANLYTDRQAVGRAFAAEFMAPMGAVVRMVEQDGRPITWIADHFGVAENVIDHQYKNSFH